MLRAVLPSHVSVCECYHEAIMPQITRITNINNIIIILLRGMGKLPSKTRRDTLVDLYQLLLWRAVYPSSAKSCAAISCECVTNEAIMPQFTRKKHNNNIITIIIIFLRGMGRLPSKTWQNTNRWVVSAASLEGRLSFICQELCCHLVCVSVCVLPTRQ